MRTLYIYFPDLTFGTDTCSLGGKYRAEDFCCGRAYGTKTYDVAREQKTGDVKKNYPSTPGRQGASTVCKNTMGTASERSIALDRCGLSVVSIAASVRMKNVRCTDAEYSDGCRVRSFDGTGPMQACCSID